MRPPHPPDSRDDLPQVLDVAAPVVLRDVPDGQHSLRRFREALERELGVTYKTAWRMANLIRNQLMVEDDDQPLSGDVEADETCIGGKPREADPPAPVG